MRNLDRTLRLTCGLILSLAVAALPALAQDDAVQTPADVDQDGVIEAGVPRPDVNPPTIDPVTESKHAVLYTGTLAGITDDHVSIANERGARMTFRVTPATKLLFASDPITLADMRQGDFVRVVSAKANPLIALTIAASKEAEPGDEDLSNVALLRAHEDDRLPDDDPAGGTAEVVDAPPVWVGFMLDPAEVGVAITRLHPEGPGTEAGLEEGDVIVRVDETAVSRPEDVYRQLDRREPGDVISFAILRGEETRTIKISLAAPPAGIYEVPVRHAVARVPLPEDAPEYIGTILQQQQEQAELLRQLMEEIRALRAELNQVRNPGGEANDAAVPLPPERVEREQPVRE